MKIFVGACLLILCTMLFALGVCGIFLMEAILVIRLFLGGVCMISAVVLGVMTVVMIRDL